MPFFASIQGSTAFGRPTPQQQQLSGYIYYRWLITDTKINPPNGNASQASEFVFQLNGTDQQATTTSATVTANPAGIFAAGEEPQKLVDGNLTTKMCDQKFVTNGSTSIIFQFSSRQTFTGYRWATANDEEGRDPKSWTLSGSQNGTTWTLLHTVTGYTATSSRNTYNPTTWAFTGGSLYFDGTTTGRLTIANDIDFRNGTGDFTIEWFMYPIANANLYPRVFQIGNYPSQSIGVSFEGSDGSRTFYFWIPTGATIVVSSTNYINAWYHIAISRSGTSLRIFVNGTQVGSTLTNSTDFSNSTDVLAIANESTASTGAAYKGYITNFRWVKGTALYTANFTRPTAPLQAVSGSSLLLLAATSGTATTDSSGKSKTVTNGGTVTWDSRSPFS